VKGKIEQPSLGEDELADLQKDTFGYFLKETNLENGMVPDSTNAIERTLVTLRFFWNSPQSAAPYAIGYQGFYYHFLDMQTGRRAPGSELSTIDTTFLLAGFLAAGMYFDRETKKEKEIRMLSHALYARADWTRAQNGALKVSHGWKPETLPKSTEAQVLGKQGSGYSLV
jgi:hypothetical protein